MHITHILLFQTTKIQTFESNSQQSVRQYRQILCCFRLQRYKLLKAIHNRMLYQISRKELFQTTKIQTFESNSQPIIFFYHTFSRCFRLQRYKLLKAIHNSCCILPKTKKLFQTTKIQTFESNSQPECRICLCL